MVEEFTSIMEKQEPQQVDMFWKEREVSLLDTVQIKAFEKNVE
jgi:hypothetical protein